MRLIRLIKLNVMKFFLFTQLQFLFEFLSLEFFENLAFFDFVMGRFCTVGDFVTGRFCNEEIL